MLQALFSSRVRVRLLTVFLLNPGARFHASALTQTVKAQYNAVWKELNNLERAGVLLRESSANTKVYSLNPRLPILSELRGIILKTAGAGDHIRNALNDLGQMDAAFIYGSFAAGDIDHQSDLDLMLIGQVDLNRLAPIIARLEKELGRAVNYIAYTPDEWREKQREPFIANVLASPKIMLIGDKDAIRATRTTRTHQAVQGTPRRNPKIVASRRARPHRRQTQSA